MSKYDPPRKIEHILCPTDLSPRSQTTLGLAARIAERLGAKLTACHCPPAVWFSADTRLPDEKINEFGQQMDEAIRQNIDPGCPLEWRSTVISNSFDPARAILNLARETGVDLIIMKARPGVMSAVRFGSIVERIVSAAPCPVLLLPTSYVDAIASDPQSVTFHRILFDYEFSQATDDLFQAALQLSRGFGAELHLMSVLEPPRTTGPEMKASGYSQLSVAVATQEKLGKMVGSTDVSASVTWGKHAESVLKYADEGAADMICTTLSPPNYYYEKLYSIYLGQLLKTAVCPILVKQSV